MSINRSGPSDVFSGGGVLIHESRKGERVHSLVQAGNVRQTETGFTLLLLNPDFFSVAKGETRKTGETGWGRRGRGDGWGPRNPRSDWTVGMRAVIGGQRKRDKVGGNLSFACCGPPERDVSL